VRSLSALRVELPRLSGAYYVAELYDRFTEQEEENPTLFQLLAQTYVALDRSANPDLVLRSFELRLLQIAGYRPHLHHCVVCQEALTEAADRFSPSLGGVLCPNDRGADRGAFTISGPAFRLLRYLQTQPVEAAEVLRLSSEVRGEAEQLLRAYLRQILERDLKSVAFLEDVARGA
jgi:DNA repair protein RecO (recombination protein O)